MTKDPNSGRVMQPGGIFFTPPTAKNREPVFEQEDAMTDMGMADEVTEEAEAAEQAALAEEPVEETVAEPIPLKPRAKKRAVTPPKE